MKYLLSTLVIAILFISCMSTPQVSEVATPQKFILEIKGVDSVKVEEEPSGDLVHKSMEVHNNAGELSTLSFVAGDKAFIKIFSGLSVADVTRVWNDFVYLENSTDIRDVDVFINSPGGDAFSGLALADEIERAKNKGFNVTAYASGIIASAAVPVFAVCSKRIAAPGTIFMTHQASLWTWPGQETAADIRSKNELMILLQDRYISYLAKNSKLSAVEWNSRIDKTTWFCVEQAIEWGLVDVME